MDQTIATFAKVMKSCYCHQNLLDLQALEAEELEVEEGQQQELGLQPFFKF